MTQTQDFMTQLSEFINTDEGLKQALQLYKGYHGTIISTVEETQDLCIPYYFDHLGAMAMGFDNCKQMIDNVWNVNAQLAIEDIMREYGDEELQAERNFEGDWEWNNLPDDVTVEYFDDDEKYYFVTREK